MKIRSFNALFFLTPLMGLIPFSVGHAQSTNDQNEARREMRAGNVLSLREIEMRILPQIRGREYLGPAYDSSAMVYRLRFIKDGKVTYVDVDARTGRIIRRPS